MSSLVIKKQAGQFLYCLACFEISCIFAVLSADTAHGGFFCSASVSIRRTGTVPCRLNALAL